MKGWIKIHSHDNVIVALKDYSEGEIIDTGEDKITLCNDIPRGHKIALEDINTHSSIKKYGQAFAKASSDIKKGEWVHTHNSQTTLDAQASYAYQPDATPITMDKDLPEIMLYRRANGKVGIRNELWIIPTVGCVNGIANQIMEKFKALYSLDDIDGIYVLNHQFGCSQMGTDHINTKQLLQLMAQHPNAGGVLVLGLGCENNQVSAFKEGIEAKNNASIRYLITQESSNEVEEGIECLKALYEHMRTAKKEKGALSELIFGLECGGSDGLSGITANPMLGLFSDRIIAKGGTAVLTEVPEMFGAEHLLMNRAKDKITYEQIVSMIEGFKDYYQSQNLPIYENPSPGNKAGGISTLEEKSLGCTQKSGSSLINSVINYAEPIKSTGLVLLNAPGNDAIATSALAAAGCHLVLFTTGRGTPYGGIVPTIKIATNTELAEKKPHWIDFNAGKLLTEDLPFEQLVEEFIHHLASIINGVPSRNEANNIRELAIWKNGVTL